jgi:ubiquinone/menaquinone biosynthesis C-methylase UbiE
VKSRRRNPRVQSPGRGSSNAKARKPRHRDSRTSREGWRGWDEYAPFYDWENARTLGRRDIPFWQQFALNAAGDVLELGCGTGRITLPLARARARIVGIDRSAAMLARANQRFTRVGLRGTTRLVRGDICHLPFGVSTFSAVLAPYGVLQSLLRERDLTATLEAVHRALKRGGTFGVDLVADLPAWEEYRKRMSLRGWRRRGDVHVTLVETVRQDRARRLTIFHQEFTERRGRDRRTSRFALTFRTLSVPQMVRRLEKAGFSITALLGDYKGGPWDPRAEVWMILARKA